MSRSPEQRSPDYARAVVAFSARLRSAMQRTGIDGSELSRRVKVSHEAITAYRWGRYLPRPDIANRIGEVLGDDKLAQIAVAGRTIRCALCGRVALRGSTRRRWCGPECRERSQRQPSSLISAVEAAVDAFCRACEPEGLCRTPDCHLQPFSPFPLIQVTRRGAA